MAADVDPNDPGIASPILTMSISPLSTLTSYSTLTNYITVYPNTSALIPSKAADESAYYYAVVNGTTSWVNGNAPPSTYHSQITKTIQVTVFPAAADPSEQTVTVSQSSSAPQTVTLTVSDPVSSSSESVPVPTSTVTSYLTREVTSVTTMLATPSAAEGDPVLPGPGQNGWNASSGSGNYDSYQTLLPGGTVVQGLTMISSNVVARTGMYLSPSHPTAAMTIGFGQNATHVTAGSNHTLSTSAVVSPMASSGHSTVSILSSSPPWPLPSVNDTTQAVSSSPQAASGTHLSTTAPGNTQPQGTTLSTSSLQGTAIISRATPAPSVCGESGDFVLNVSISHTRYCNLS